MRRRVEEAVDLGRHEGGAEHAKEEEAAHAPELGLSVVLGAHLRVDVSHELLDLCGHDALAVDDALEQLLCDQPQLEAVDGGVRRVVDPVRVDLHRRGAQQVQAEPAVFRQLGLV